MGKIVVVVMMRVVFGTPRIAATAPTGKSRPKALIKLGIQEM